IERHRLGTDAPDGAVIYTYLAKDDPGATLDILDAGGKTVRHFSARDAAADASLKSHGEPPWLEPPNNFWRAGLNRFVWNLRYPSGGGLPGPKVVPGAYQVRLTSTSLSQTEPLRLLKDPRPAEVTDADLQQQFTLLTQIVDRAGEISSAVDAIRD